MAGVMTDYRRSGTAVREGWRRSLGCVWHKCVQRLSRSSTDQIMGSSFCIFYADFGHTAGIPLNGRVLVVYKLKTVKKLIPSFLSPLWNPFVARAHTEIKLEMSVKIVLSGEL